jgi:hypothetical protein
MPIEKFGKPRIKLADSTTVMEVAFVGASPAEARNKSFALYKALQARLNELRDQNFLNGIRDFSLPLVLPKEN